MLRVSIGIACAVLAASVSSAVAQQRIQIGVLECGGNTTSFIVGSVTDMRCTFKPAGGGAHFYSATIRRVGVDIGVNQQVAVAWAVLAPTRSVGPGDLQGTYAGVSAGATIGVGLGANALVGGSNNTFALQPVSGQAQTGLSIAAGVAGLDLRAVRN